MEPTAFFDFPSRGKAVFRWFLIFPRGRKLIFVRRTPTKRDFSYFPLIVGVRSLVLCVFHQSYPYKSFFFLFFVDCIPYLNKFSRKLIIYPRIWVIFLENRWLYPVSEQIFPKIDNLPPYLSYFSWKSMIVPRIWADFLENDRLFLCLKTSFDYRFIFLSWHSFSYKKGKKE